MFGNSRNFSTNVSCGRDQNLNNGSGSMTINNSGRWRAPSSAYSLRHAFPGFSNNMGSGARNVNFGRDQNTNGGAGAFTINNDDGARRNPSPTIQTPIRGLEGSNSRREPAAWPGPSANLANPRPSSGRRLTPEKLRREENTFRQLLDSPEQYEDILTVDGEDAQELLNDWQRLSECTNDTALRSQIVRTMNELSDKSGLFPQCLWITETVKDFCTRRMEVGGLADLWMGNFNRSRVAMKVIRHRVDIHKREQVVKAFTRQAMVWRNLDHSNIMPFTGMNWFNEDQEQICLVFPWMENGNLLQFLKDHPELGFETQLSLAKDVAQGLAYLHNLGIIHGDLKSYNVLITSDRTACITDLGLSPVLEGEEALGLSTASSCWRPVRWLAPELMKNGKRPVLSLESDIYAFGCVCYEIYARSIPFHDIEEYRIYYVVAVQNQHPEPPPQAPDAMRRLMESCWNVEPASRPKAVDIVDGIGRIQAGGPGVIAPEDPRPFDFSLYFWLLLGWLMPLIWR
ncbi:Rho guanine nucleotide exchange factor [Marasmius tenuissimus]|nr:Rho guanine nucleotide exchange factor [Marasmius tenuissimus]